MRIRAAAIGVSVLLSCRAAPAAAAAAPPDDYADVRVDDEEPAPASTGFHLDSPSKFGFGLEGYGGIATGFNSGPVRAHALVGGLARFRLHYFQIGGTFEITDSGEDKTFDESPLENWRAASGFIGVLLPYNRWITLDGSVGLGSRTYTNPSTIYGDQGLSKSLTALTFRLAISDRLTHKLISPRIGAALNVAADLSSVDVPWTRRYTSVSGIASETKGTTAIGGVSVALVVDVGFELGGRPR